MAILTAATFLLMAGPAAAADSPKDPTDQRIQVTGRKLPRRREDPERMVCKSFQPTGSRVHTAKVCKAKRQWEYEELETQMAMQRLQARDGGDENPQTPHVMPK